MAQSNLPNLLFIFTDQQRLDSFACYGNQQIQMPNLDELAGRSCIFREPYCSSPVCTPSRGTIMTGLYPHQHGAYTNNIPMKSTAGTIPELLAPAVRREYVTGYHGKWHLGDEIFRQHGFDEWVSIEDLYIPHYSPGRDPSARSDYHHFLVGQGFTLGTGHVFKRDFASQLPEHYGKPQFLADHAARFIRENRDRPFMLFVNFPEPHRPFHGPRNGQYRPEEIPLPENHQSPPDQDSPPWYQILAERFRRQGHGGFRLEGEGDWREMIGRYWGLCSLVDTHIGRILRTLSDCGLEDRTIVVFTSDHGEMMGSHRLLTKGVMYKEATQVPLLVHLPGQTEGGQVTGPVSQIDLVPTVLDLLGQPADPNLPGCSLTPLVKKAAKGGEVSSAEAASRVIIQWYGRERLGQVPSWMTELTGRSPEDCVASAAAHRRSIVSESWRFTCSSAGDHELYNSGEDPLEMVNLAESAEHRETARGLLAELREWQGRVGDKLILPDL
jgi:arylsulfatase A-like enzyme